MKSIKTTSKILLVVAALSMAAVGCERRAGDQSSGAGGTSGSSSSGAAGTGSPGAPGGSGTSGTNGAGTSK